MAHGVHDSNAVRRLVVQSLRTDQLLGVDFVPRREVDTLLAAIGSVGSPPRTEAAGSARSAATATDAPPTTRSTSVPRPEPESGRAAPPPVVIPTLASAGGGRHGGGGDPAARLAALRERHDAECPHCTVATAHTRTVFGEGDPNASLMFVGEAPGETEDRLGRPFVGRAGQKLDEIITAMGLSRDRVYIANVLKSRPPENRTPLRHEIEGCGPYLREQIRIIGPGAIVTLGGPATKLLLGVETGITRLRGVWAEYRDGDVVVPVMPTFHPAYLLRNYTPETRKQVWSDMLKVCEHLGIGPRR